MRIGTRVAVSWKMLGGGKHAFLPRAFDVSAHQAGDLGGIFAKSARIDDGGGGLGIHVGNRKEVPLHSNGTPLLRHSLAGLCSTLRFTGSAEGHGMRKAGHAI